MYMTLAPDSSLLRPASPWTLSPSLWPTRTPNVHIQRTRARSSKHPACIVADLGVWLSTNCTGAGRSSDCKGALDALPRDHVGYGFAATYKEYYGSTCATAGCFLNAAASPVFASDPTKADRAINDTCAWDFYRVNGQIQMTK